MSSYTIYQKDCFEVFNELEQVDAIICDVPYNINYDKWDKDFNIARAIFNCSKLLKPNGNIIIFNGWSNVCETKTILDKYFVLQNWIIWDRVKGRGSKKNLVSTREDILWYSNGNNPTYNKVYSNIRKKTKGMGEKNGQEYRALSNVWTDISPIVPWSKERNNHPTQKPLSIMERCISIWTNENDTVLDFTMGSGTTGIACMKLNRNFIGIEINEEYFKIAKDRLEECSLKALNAKE